MNNPLKLTLAAAALLIGVGFVVAQQPVSVTTLPALTTGANTIGSVTQASGPWTQNTTQLNSVALGSPSAYGTSPGAVNVPGVNAYITNTPAVTFGPVTTSGGATSTKQLVESTSTYDTVKASAGNVYGLTVYNGNTAPCFLVFYDSTSPTIGTTTKVASFGIQAGTQMVLHGGAIALNNYATGITVANTTTAAGSSVCAVGMTLNVFYQ